MFFVQITFQMYDLFPYYYYSQFLCTFVSTKLRKECNLLEMSVG